MQDYLLQLIQLMQYRMIESFSLTLSNSVIGSDVTISQDSLDGFLASWFDKSQRDENGRGFTLSTTRPICIVQYHDSYTWAKYCQRLFPFDVSQVTNTGLHESFHKSMIEFLQTDINQYSSYMVDQVILDKLQKFLQDMLLSSSDAQQISNSFDRHLKDEEAMNTVVGAINKIATSATTIPLSLFTSMMHQRFKKHTFF
jgi:hypothetical protein